MQRQRAAAWDADVARDRLWDLSADLMGAVDDTGRILAFNDAWTLTLGFSRQEIEKTNLFALVHPDDRQATRAEIERLASGGEPQRYVNRLIDREGGVRIISWRAAREGVLTYGVGRDATEWLQREEALRQAQKLEALGQLTGGIAHDFNNLLTIMRSSAEFLNREVITEERRTRYRHALCDAVERATKLTGQLLAFARRQKLEPEIFDARERIADISELLRQLVGPLIEIHTSVPGEPCRIEADICQFETALMNLAINARDAMEGRGRLTVEIRLVDEVPSLRGHAAARGRFVAVSLRDTGPGVDPAHLDKLFDPFFSTKEVGHGTGLGLSQVYGFVKQSGGNVEVRSEVGSGAEFTIYLPQVDATGGREARLDQATQPQAPGARNVLLVEDNEQVGAFTQQLLRDMGYEATWARNADEALRLLDRVGRPWDVIFSDVVMPGLSGLELAELVARRANGVPVLLASGYSPALLAGAPEGVEVLPKPYTAEEVSHAIERALNKAS